MACIYVIPLKFSAFAKLHSNEREQIEEGKILGRGQMAPKCMLWQVSDMIANTNAVIIIIIKCFLPSLLVPFENLVIITATCQVDNYPQLHRLALFSDCKRM